MAFQISPGVNVSEVDLTTVVPSLQTTAGAFVGTFPWGPANQIKSIDNEIVLVNTFAPQGPDSSSAIDFFTAANFLAYGNNLNLVRVVGTSAKNASSNTNNQILVKNEDIFEATYLSQNNANVAGPFIGRYAGTLGNSIEVHVFDSANAEMFSTWTYKGYVSSKPGTSEYVSNLGGSDDEMHIIVVDADGAITGSSGTVLEVYPFISKAVDATINGATNYYKQVLAKNSKYVYAMDPVEYSSTSSTWGQAAAGRTFARISTKDTTGYITSVLTGGVDSTPDSGAIQTGYDLFANKETIDISLVLTGAHTASIQNYVIDSIASARKDCVAFVSPRLADVLNNTGSESSDIVDSWLTALNTTSSYAVADSGWKYQYDKYNNVYRWIPLNGDVAGLCVQTDTARDPWYSPAGFNRGSIKNCIKLAWNPNKTERNTLYAAGVNPVVTFPGQGAILFGDKTLLNKPSAFDRINVRRLFIVLEKAIAKASQFSLFELNDEFTRAQFIALVTPFLRDVQGRHGITDFKVICDSTNNTQQVIDSNQFVGDIYIKPARSINYIQLNFVAVNSGVDFTTIVGAV